MSATHFVVGAGQRTQHITTTSFSRVGAVLTKQETWRVFALSAINVRISSTKGSRSIRGNYSWSLMSAERTLSWLSEDQGWTDAVEGVISERWTTDVYFGTKM